MVRRGLFIVTIVVLAIAALVVPESRRVLRMQASYLASGRAYPDHSLADEEWPDMLRSMARKSDAALEHDWRTYIARAELDRPRRLEYANKAVAAGPNRPEAYAAAISMCQSRFHRPEADLVQKPYDTASKDLDPDVGDALLNLADKGSRLDPDNAFFDLMAANALFGMHKDSQALDLIRSAARKKHYDPYRQVAGVAMVEYLEASGAPRMEAQTTFFMLGFPYLAGLRHMSLLTVWHARQLEAEGHSDQAEGLLTALVKIGGLMRRDSKSIIEHLVAIAVQSTAGLIEPIPEIERPHNPPPDWHRERDRLRAEQAAKVLRAHGWHDLARLFEQESETALEFRKRLSRDYGPWVSDLCDRTNLTLAATRVGSSSLRFALVLFIIAGPIWLAGRGRESAPELSRPGKAALAILVLVPWAIATALVAAHSMVHTSRFDIPVLDLGAVVWPLALLALYSWLAVFQVRRLPGPSEPRSSMRVILLTLTVILAIPPLAALVQIAASSSFPQSFWLRVSARNIAFEFSFLVSILTAMLLLPVGLVWLAVWEIRNMPEPRDRRRPMRVALLAMSILGPLVVVPWLYIAQLPDLHVPAVSLVWGLMALAFVAGRVILLRRGGRCQGVGACVLDTVRQSSRCLAKVLLVLYFVILFGQLPFRARVTERVHALHVNEVQAVMSAPGPSGSSTGK